VGLSSFFLLKLARVVSMSEKKNGAFNVRALDVAGLSDFDLAAVACLLGVDGVLAGLDGLIGFLIVACCLLGDGVVWAGSASSWLLVVGGGLAIGVICWLLGVVAGWAGGAGCCAGGCFLGGVFGFGAASSVEECC
jgi:hypothetical protein